MNKNSKFTSEQLMVEIGRTLLMCQVVEKQFLNLLTWIHPDRKVSVETVCNMERRPETLGRLVRRAAAHFRYEAPLRDAVIAFANQRNTFVHSLIRIRGFSLDTVEGRNAVATFVLDLYIKASALQRGLEPLITRWAKEMGLPVHKKADA